MMSNAPCKDCSHKGCGTYHERCEPYIEWKRTQEKINANKRKYNAENGIRYDTQYGRW